MLDLTLLAFLGFLFLLVLVVILAGFGGMWFSQRQAARLQEQENDLKRDLVARGLPADEIERIIRASSGMAKAKPAAAAEKRTRDFYDRAYLVQLLCGHGVEGADQERVLLTVAGVRDPEELSEKV